VTTRTILCLGLLCGSLLLPLAACHHAAAPEPDPTQLSQEGERAFERKKWAQAVDAFQKLKDRYPFSPYALTAEMKIADALYMQEKYEEAIAAYQEFERMHPRNEQVPYAIYMQGEANNKRMLSQDRDQAPTAEALRNFQRLVTDYPDSPLVAQAKARIVEAQDRLAAQELYVARWYERTGHPRSALARLSYLLKNYAQTPSAQAARRLLPEVQAAVAKETAKGEHPSEIGPAPAPIDSGGVYQERRPPVP